MVDLKKIPFGWDGGIRTPECQDQNLVPYHLATSQYPTILPNYNLKIKYYRGHFLAISRAFLVI